MRFCADVDFLLTTPSPPLPYVSATPMRMRQEKPRPELVGCHADVAHSNTHAQHLCPVGTKKSSASHDFSDFSRENLQQTIGFPIKNGGFLQSVPLNQSKE